MQSDIDFYKRWHKLSKPYFSWQFRQFKPYIGQRVADLGCGLGNFTSHLLDRELYLGVDFDSRFVSEILNEYGAYKNVEAVEADVTNSRTYSIIKEKHIDTILCVNVMEHIEDDKGFLQNMVHALPAGGHLCILVPAFQCLFGSLDKADYHFRRYTKKSMIKLFHEMPVNILKKYYLNFVGAIGWFIMGRIVKQKIHSNSNFTLMNKVLPIVSFCERIIHPPFGQSLVIIIRKNQ